MDIFIHTVDYFIQNVDFFIHSLDSLIQSLDKIIHLLDFLFIRSDVKKGGQSPVNSEEELRLGSYGRLEGYLEKTTPPTG